MIPILIFLMFSTAYAAPAAKPKGCVSAECHGTMLKKAFVHTAVNEDSCQDCHSASKGSAPYESGARHRFDKVSVPKKCFECHEAPQGASVHEPVRGGECLSCHNPHASDQKHLLARPYSAGWYGDPTAKAYALCFDCHDEKMLLEKKTGDATEFRDGTRNLHFVHVLALPRGRSCSACHGVHAAEGAKLIPTSVPFFGYRVPLNFRAGDKGASCFPACHEKKMYVRSAKSH
ncbi:MAG: cytochrome c3 family protein [Pseudomonadota bacterium]